MLDSQQGLYVAYVLWANIIYIGVATIFKGGDWNTQCTDLSLNYVSVFLCTFFYAPNFTQRDLSWCFGGEIQFSTRAIYSLYSREQMVRMGSTGAIRVRSAYTNRFVSCVYSKTTPRTAVWNQLPLSTRNALLLCSCVVLRLYTQYPNCNSFKCRPLHFCRLAAKWASQVTVMCALLAGWVARALEGRATMREWLDGWIVTSLMCGAAFC